MKTAEQVLAAIAERGFMPDLTAIAAAHAVTPGVLVCSRNRHAIAGRFAFWWHLANTHRLSSVEIGELCGRHNSSVSVGIRAHEFRRQRTELEVGAPGSVVREVSE